MGRKVKAGMKEDSLGNIAVSYGVKERYRWESTAVLCDIVCSFADSLAHAVEKAQESISDYCLLNSIYIFFLF